MNAIPCEIPPQQPGLQMGDRFTIKGIKVISPNGAFITDCPPGEETVFVAAPRSISRIGK